MVNHDINNIYVVNELVQGSRQNRLIETNLENDKQIPFSNNAS